MHKISKPAASASAHFLGSRPRNTASLIRSQLDYVCIVYGSARGSYLRKLDPIQNHALCLCLCAYRTSPASAYAWKQMSSLYFRRKKLSLQYCLKLSCKYNNPAYVTVFNSKCHSVFERKPTQLPPLAIRVSGDLQAVGYYGWSDVITSSIPTTLPWLLTRPVVNFPLHCSDKSNTPPEIFKHRFYELCHEFNYRIFTDGCKEGNRVAAAVVHRDNTKCIQLPDTASIFRAELYALLLAIDVVRRSKEKNFVIFSDSMSSLQSISGFNLEVK